VPAGGGAASGPAPSCGRGAPGAGLPYFHVSISPDTKPQAEQRLLEFVDDYQVDLVVLARYMQVLSDRLCRRLHGWAINIHHSFLPGFKGLALRAPRRAERPQHRGLPLTEITTRRAWLEWAAEPGSLP
jgi:formyltetrahydrofolate hydrolase